MFVYAKTSIYTDDIHCNYPRRDGQAELVSVADYLQNGLPANKRLPTVVLTALDVEQLLSRLSQDANSALTDKNPSILNVLCNVGVKLLVHEPDQILVPPELANSTNVFLKVQLP